MADVQHNRERAAAACCAAVVLAAAALYALVGVQVTAWEFDESGYRLSAVHYANGFPNALLHDPTAYATGRLYPLLLVPLFAVLDGPDGVQAAKVLNGLLWASTAIPLWLLARPLLTPWRRAAAVSLGVVTPWMALTTLMFTENIAIPAFVWFTYAALMAVRRPVWWRDLLALVALGVALGSRAQLVSLGLGYLALIAWTMPVPAVAERGPRAWRIRALARHLRRGFPCTSAVLVLGVLAAVGLLLAGQGDRLSKLGRGYIAERTPWLIDLAPLVLLDTLVIACGVGVVALLIGVPWLVRSAAPGGRDGDRWWFAAAVVCTSLSLIGFTAIVQGGWWGELSEERYWVYPAGFLWIAAFAAAQRREIKTSDVAVTGGALVLIAGGLELPRTLDSISVVLAPVMGTLGNLTSGALDPVMSEGRDQVVLGLLVVVGLCLLVLARLPRVRPEWLLGAGAGIQVVLTVVPALAMTGAIVDRADRTQGDVDALGWIDEQVDGPVTWLPGEPRRDGDAAIRSQQQWLYWNRRVTTRTSVVDSTPWLKAPRIGALHETSLRVDDRTGIVTPQPPSRLVVTWRDSPHHQPVGEVLARAPGDGQELVRLDEPARLRFRSTGLEHGDRIPPGRPVALWFWPAAGRGLTAAVTFTGGDSQPMTVRVGDRAPVTAAPRTPVTVNLRICDAAEQVPVQVEGAGDVVTMDAVAIRPAPPCRRAEAGGSRPSG